VLLGRFRGPAGIRYRSTSIVRSQASLVTIMAKFTPYIQRRHRPVHDQHHRPGWHHLSCPPHRRRGTAVAFLCGRADLIVIEAADRRQLCCAACECGRTPPGWSHVYGQPDGAIAVSERRLIVEPEKDRKRQEPSQAAGAPVQAGDDRRPDPRGEAAGSTLRQLPAGAPSLYRSWEPRPAQAHAGAGGG
jgi:hypothetical protein